MDGIYVSVEGDRRHADGEWVSEWVSEGGREGVRGGGVWGSSLSGMAQFGCPEWARDERRALGLSTNQPHSHRNGMPTEYQSLLAHASCQPSPMARHANTANCSTQWANYFCLTTHNTGNTPAIKNKNNNQSNCVRAEMEVQWHSREIGFFLKILNGINTTVPNSSVQQDNARVNLRFLFLLLSV